MTETSETGTRHDILRELSGMVAPYNINQVDITENTNMSEELDIDSVAVMDLIMAVEEKFEISIPINLIYDVRTVGDFCKIIEDGLEGR